MGLADKTVASVSPQGATHPAGEYEVRHRLVQRVALLTPELDSQGSSNAVQHGNLMLELYTNLRRRFENICAVATLFLGSINARRLQARFG